MDHRRLELEKTSKKIYKCPSFPDYRTEVEWLYLKSHSYLVAEPGETNSRLSTAKYEPDSILFHIFVHLAS